MNVWNIIWIGYVYKPRRSHKTAHAAYMQYLQQRSKSKSTSLLPAISDTVSTLHSHKNCNDVPETTKDFLFSQQRSRQALLSSNQLNNSVFTHYNRKDDDLTVIKGSYDSCRRFEWLRSISLLLKSLSVFVDEKDWGSLGSYESGQGFVWDWSRVRITAIIWGLYDGNQRFLWE